MIALMTSQVCGVQPPPSRGKSHVHYKPLLCCLSRFGVPQVPTSALTKTQWQITSLHSSTAQFSLLSMFISGQQLLCYTDCQRIPAKASSPTSSVHSLSDRLPFSLLPLSTYIDRALSRTCHVQVTSIKHNFFVKRVQATLAKPRINHVTRLKML